MQGHHSAHKTYKTNWLERLRASQHVSECLRTRSLTQWKKRCHDSIYTCACVCVCVYIYIYIYIYIRRARYTCTRAHTYIYICINMYIYILYTGCLMFIFQATFAHRFVEIRDASAIIHTNAAPCSFTTERPTETQRHNGTETEMQMHACT